VLDGEAIVLRPDNTSDFEGLRSRRGQAEAILLAYDLMELDGQNMRLEALEECRKRLARLLSRSNKALRDVQLSEAITCPCRKLDPDVMMVQSAEDRQRKNAADRLDRPRQR
jgi:ATP-dependent DNA ligase